MRKRLFILLSLLLLALVSCSKVSEQTPCPEWCTLLVQAYGKGLQLENISYGIAVVQLNFENNYGITISLQQIRLDDCRSKDHAVVAYDSDYDWMVDGESTGVHRDATRSNSEALPVYAYFDSSGFRLYLSNGNCLFFSLPESDPEPEPEPEPEPTPIQYDHPLPDGVTSLPLVYVNTVNGASISSKTTYVDGVIKIMCTEDCHWDFPDLDSEIQIRGRGNSTWGMEKKPYKIKLESKASVLGMPKDKEWCLIANYCDKSLLRNTVAMELSRIAGFSWTPRSVPVELYLNGSYKGVYDLFEHKKVSFDRVDIDVDAGDIYFELESNKDEPVCWTTDHGAPVMFLDPQYPTQTQQSEAKAWFKGFETTLWKGNFTNRTDHYSDYIDLPSFVNYFVVQELTKNVDGNLRKSTFITWPKGGKLEMYHVWDFDICLGNCDYYGDGLQTWEGWWIKDRGDWGYGHGWYYHLFQDPEFVSLVKERWDELYPEFQKIPDFINERVEILGEAPSRNFNKWRTLGYYVWPNAKVTGSYEGEVDWLLENYNKRLEWLDSHIRAL